jgi:UDP-glucose:tetrahydrobiopterin glucosyltransferase
VRIALVAPLVTPITEPQLGGSQALLADIAQGLVARGHDVSVFAASGSRIEGVHVVDTGVDPSALASTLFRAGRAAARASSAAHDAFATTYGLVRRERFDVVHNHAFDAPAISLASGLGATVVHTLHLPPQPEIIAALERGPGAVVCCVSDRHADAWSHHVGVDVVLCNGVPAKRIPFSPDGGATALFAGRLSPEKGAREAVEIARLAGLRLTVVGDAYDPAYAVEGARGAVPREELWTLMGASKVVLCPARWEEPFGLVAAEAQAAGTPVIAFRRGALVDVVRDGETGYLVDDVDGAVRAVDIIGRIDRSACRRHAELHLDLERTLDLHEELYGRIA